MMAEKDMVRFRATAQDKMQHASRYLCDQLLHVVMRFDTLLDETRLRRATRLLHEVEPVLACRWVNARDPFWQHKAGAYSFASFMLVPCEDPMAEAMQFINVRADPGSDPLIQVHVFRGRFDVVVLKVNHVVCDAHGARHIAYLLAELYNDKSEKDWTAGERVTERGMRPIWKSFPLGRRMHFARIALKVMRQRPAPPATVWSLPFTSRDARDPMMLIRNYDSERSRRITSYGKERSATVNDVFLTAFIRSSHAVIGSKEGVPVPFQVAFDLRQFAPGKGADIANLTSAVFLSHDRDAKRTFDEDLKAIKAEMDRAKEERRAGVGMPLLKLTYGTRSFEKVERSFESAFEASVKQRNVRPLFTNLGRLEQDRMQFGDTSPSLAFITSPITYPPLLVVGLSSYNGAFTLCTGFCGYGVDPALMEELMAEMDRNLPQ